MDTLKYFSKTVDKSRLFYGLLMPKIIVLFAGVGELSLGSARAGLGCAFYVPMRDVLGKGIWVQMESRSH